MNSKPQTINRDNELSTTHMTNNKKDALGKGIRSLLQNIDADLKSTTGSLKAEQEEQNTGILRKPLLQIEVNPKQPRKD